MESNSGICEKVTLGYAGFTPHGQPTRGGATSPPLGIFINRYERVEKRRIKAVSEEKMRYGVGQGGQDEPGLILIVDHSTHTIVARSSEMALEAVRELVKNANEGVINRRE